MKIKTYPFNAIAGQDIMKKALILNIVNPKIGGLLISGEKGTAKSTMVRGIADIIDDISFVNLPLNITEDRLVGSIDIEKALYDGSSELDYGLLKKADGNILYIDEVNLLSKYIVNVLLEVNSSGINDVQREGISKKHSSDFILVGSMNPEEGFLGSQFIDRFGLFVEVKSEKDITIRTEIMKRRLEFEKNPNEFGEKYLHDDLELKRQIKAAKSLLKDVVICDDSLFKISEISLAGKCQGHRAEIVMLETAKAICTLNGRKTIKFCDIEEAAKYALPHRIRENVDIDEFERKNDQTECVQDQNQEQEQNGEETQDLKQEQEDTQNSDKQNFKGNDNTDINERNQENFDDSTMTDDSGENSKIGASDNRLKIRIDSAIKKSNGGSGKRSKTRTDAKSGRYIKYKFSNGNTKDIALDATIRNAAIKQKSRDTSSENLALIIKREDIREKVRETRTGATILFLVDASGSMGAKSRMVAVKGAVLSLLNDAYQKRDNIGIIAFRRNSADVILNITRSADLAQKSLKKLKTGGKTPLAFGLYKANELLKIEKIKKKGSLQYLVLVTDGKANIGMHSEDIHGEVLKIADEIKYNGIESMVLDTENGMIEFGFAKKISEHLGAEYVKLNTFSKAEVKSKVKDLIK